MGGWYVTNDHLMENANPQTKVGQSSMQCYYVMVYKYKNMKTFFYVFANLTNQNMPVVILSIAAAAIRGTAYYMRKRSKLKDGDKDIAKERQRKKKIELLKGGSSLPTVVAQILHPEHELFLDFGQTYRYNLYTFSEF